jgi:hypothetical protein
MRERKNDMKIPCETLKIFENETDGLDFGEVTLTVYLKDGKPRFVIGRQRSIVMKYAGNSEKGKKDCYPIAN